jgi:hypothetical protein
MTVVIDKYSMICNATRLFNSAHVLCRIPIDSIS